MLKLFILRLFVIKCSDEDENMDLAKVLDEFFQTKAYDINQSDYLFYMNHINFPVNDQNDNESDNESYNTYLKTSNQVCLPHFNTIAPIRLRPTFDKLIEQYEETDHNCTQLRTGNSNEKFMKHLTNKQEPETEALPYENISLTKPSEKPPETTNFNKYKQDFKRINEKSDEQATSLNYFYPSTSINNPQEKNLPQSSETSDFNSFPTQHLLIPNLNNQYITQKDLSFAQSNPGTSFSVRSNEKRKPENSIFAEHNFKRTKERLKNNPKLVEPQEVTSQIKYIPSTFSHAVPDCNSYNFLEKFNDFLLRIEEKLNLYFVEKEVNTKLDVETLLYSPDLSIITGFSFILFGEFEIKTIDILDKISSTADMLDKFINSLNLDKSEEIIHCLAKCLNIEITVSEFEEQMAKELKKQILSYLKSDESIYLKSISIELYSFITFFDELLASNDFGIVKGFIAFLILVKRNFKNTPKLKERLQSCKAYFKIDLLCDESLNSSAIFFVFLNNLPFSDSSIIIHNMRKSIFYNCCIKKKKELEDNKAWSEVFFILKHLFFNLRNFKIISNPIEIETIRDDNERERKCKKIRTGMLQGKEIIDNIQPEILEGIKPSLTKCTLPKSLKEKILLYINQPNSTNIYQLKLLLDTSRILIVYDDCKMRGAIGKHLNSLYKISKKLNSQQNPEKR